MHLTTTDPAAHVNQTLAGELPGLKVDRIDPVAETQACIAKIMASMGKHLDADGKALLLMDATGAYHRQMTQQYEGMANAKHIVTPLMRLQDPDTTRVLLVTLPETTPVTQAAALQDDLRRAHSEPWAWVCMSQRGQCLRLAGVEHVGLKRV